MRSGRWIGLLGVMTVALTLALGWPSAGRAQPAQPQYVARWDRQESGVTDDLFAVAFADELTGWAVGQNNTILRTLDGGDTWTRLVERREKGPEFRKVFAVSRTEVWVATEIAGTTLHSSDGGQTWQQAKVPEGDRGMRVAPATLGGAYLQLGRTTVKRTDDGGQTWRELPGKLPHNDYRSLSFADDMNGWAVREEGKPDATHLWGGLAMTKDGGQTWQELSVLGGARLRKVQFVNAAVGWIMPDAGGMILNSPDGGRTWTALPLGIPDYRTIEDMAFMSDQAGHVLAYGDNTIGNVFRTTDGGQSFNLIGVFDNPKFVRAVTFPTGENGWVVGDRGYITHYHLVPVEPTTSSG